MQPLFIPETDNTPTIDFNASTGSLRIAGESFPPFAMKFYTPVLSWLQEYLSQTSRNNVQTNSQNNSQQSTQNNAPVTFDVDMTYFNTSSYKALLNIVSLLEQAHNAGVTVRVRWHYTEENEIIRESGEELLEGTNLVAEFVEHSTDAPDR